MASRRSGAGLLGRWLAPAPLRPPGALAEDDFAARCIRCGRCIEVCPYRALRPAGARLGLEAGTPFVSPREAPCHLCMRCPPACPTGALEPLREPGRVRMGLAVVDRDRCYAHLGIVCRSCVDACPLGAAAIRQDEDLRPVVTDGCAGCGVCEFRCPAEGSAIRVRPEGEVDRASAPRARPGAGP